MATPTTTSNIYGLSDTLQKKVLDFLWARKTGNITLNVKDGQVLSWQFTEFGRPSNGDVDNIRKATDNR